MIEKFVNKILCGYNQKWLAKMPDNSIDAVVTDPPYGIAFMNKKWDYDVPSVETWKEVYRVLKPGGHILVACGTRTQHRMACNIEDAGFEIRDLIDDLYDNNYDLELFFNSLNDEQKHAFAKIMDDQGFSGIFAWIHGQGFPKNKDIGKEVDKILGNEREVVGKYQFPDGSYQRKNARAGIYSEQKGQAINTKGNSEFEGFGTALKPAMELWTLARKPLSEKNVAQNCLKWGTGGINIDACRVGNEVMTEGRMSQGKDGTGIYNSNGRDVKNGNWKQKENYMPQTHIGRWPANVIHDGSDEVLALFPETKSGKLNQANVKAEDKIYGGGFGNGKTNPKIYESSEGSAARFFYCAKASPKERNEGLDGLEKKMSKKMDGGKFMSSEDNEATNRKAENFHPTVKPLSLMEYFVNLLTNQGDIVLDPFAGSGTTGKACVKTDRKFILIELGKQYIPIIFGRVNHALKEKTEEKPDDGQLMLF